MQSGFIQPQALRTCWVIITCCPDLHSLSSGCSVRQAREKDKLVLSFLCNPWSIILVFLKAAALTSTLKVTIPHIYKELWKTTLGWLTISSPGNVFEGTRCHSIPASLLLSSGRYKLSLWENTILCMSHWKASSVRHLMIHSPTCWSPHADDSFCPQEESPGIPKSPHLFQSW